MLCFLVGKEMISIHVGETLPDLFTVESSEQSMVKWVKDEKKTGQLLGTSVFTQRDTD